ncbi:MAG: outer membrane protein assembly factor BamA [Candidatus Cloacimonetes bacterium]|jgi:outer membrane protein insertion porin family|nr:outer membrane protein assembly factor BamA [Candidatus Cloacimonadota bacterium]MDD4155738.1 outer membrane protein assembly factor BamA [Candidatus Cloacimonadota bacterium]
MQYFRKLWFLLIFLFLLTTHLFSQSFLILDIKVIGTQKIDTDLILATSGIKIGDAFYPELISNAIKSLYKLNVFNDVNIEIKEINEGSGLRLEIIVEELPVISKITYEGNKAISTSKIEEISTLRLGSYWSPIIKAENTRKLLSEYKSKSYNLAQIDYEVKEIQNINSIDDSSTQTEAVEIKIIVNEGKRIAVRRINIYGNNEIQTKKLLSKMKTKRKNLFRSGAYEETKFQEDLKLIVEFYNKEGFIDARILKTEQSIDDNRFLTINIYVDEGKKYFFGKIDVTGNQHFDKDTILNNFTFKENEIFDMDKFSNQMQKVASLYYEEGYIYANFEPGINKTDNKVNINLIIEENTRAKIHKIHITGNTKTKEKIIRRQLVITPGDYFRQSRVIRSQQNVYNLGFFEPDLGINYDQINSKGDVDLYLNVTDKTSGSANGGIGYNSRDKIVGQFSISHNNIFGNYWQGNLKWEFSKTTQNVEFDFTNPYLYDTDILFGFNIYHTKKEWVDYNYDIYTNGGGFRFGYPIKFVDNSKIIAGYSLYSKKYEIRNLDNYFSSNLAKLDSLGLQYTSSVNVTIIRDSRDNVFFPTSGSRFTLYSELAGGPFAGDFNYFKQIAEISWFTPAFYTTVLRTKWRFGYITGYGNSSNEVPPDERFYLGGTGSDGLRGYADRSIGPIDGGAREILFSTELGIPISSDQVIGLLFLDAGNCYNKLEDFNFNDFKKGAGLGVRIRTPFGLIGFDYAHNFEKKKWEPHFQFGTTF